MPLLASCRGLTVTARQWHQYDPLRTLWRSEVAQIIGLQNAPNKKLARPDRRGRRVRLSNFGDRTARRWRLPGDTNAVDDDDIEGAYRICCCAGANA